MLCAGRPGCCARACGRLDTGQTICKALETIVRLPVTAGACTFSVSNMQCTQSAMRQVRLEAAIKAPCACWQTHLQALVPFDMANMSQHSDGYRFRRQMKGVTSSNANLPWDHVQFCRQQMCVAVSGFQLNRVFQPMYVAHRWPIFTFQELQLDMTCIVAADLCQHQRLKCLFGCTARQSSTLFMFSF